MRHLLASMLLAAVATTASSQGLRAQSGTVTPAPLPNPVLPLQSFNACMITCGTQAGSCQSNCIALASGAQTTPSSTAVGVTTNPTQCYLNCTSQQLLCQQTCH
jgi:hypothetical protein